MERFMEFQFVAAQRLTGVGGSHRAAFLHGHTFQIRVSIEAAMDPGMDWIIDPAEMRARVEGVLEEVDHRYLNEVPGLENPSTEAVCRFLQDRLANCLPGRVGIEIRENRDVGCHLAAAAAAGGAMP